MKGNRFYHRVELLNIFLAILGTIFMVSTWKLWGSTIKLEPLGEAGFPFIISSLLVFATIILVFHEAFKLPMDRTYKIVLRDVRTIRWIFLVVWSVLYIFVVGSLGFVLTSILYQVGLMISLGASKKSNIALAILISVVFTLIIYLSYTGIFHIPVPGAL